MAFTLWKRSRLAAFVALLTLGAIGPETHAYGSTAVHWYMKQKRQ